MDNHVDNFLGNLLLGISAKPLPHSIAWDVENNPDGVVTLVRNAVLDLQILSGTFKAQEPQQVGKPILNSVETIQKPVKSAVSFEVHSEVLCKSAVREQIHLQIYKQQEGAYFIEDEELNDVRKLVLTGAI